MSSRSVHHAAPAALAGSHRPSRAAAAAVAAWLMGPSLAYATPSEVAGALSGTPPSEGGSNASAPAPTNAPSPADAPAPPRAATHGGSLAGAAAAVVPGFLLHGAGHFVAGERDDAVRLLAIEGVGLLAFAGGMTVLTVSGAADPLAPVYILPAVSGLSVFALTWLVDLVGAARGTDPWPVPGPPGTLSVQAGYVGLYGTAFDFQNDLALAATWHGERLWVSPWTVAHPGGLDYWALGTRAGYILWQPAGEPVTRLSAVVSLAHQRFRADRFRVLTGEAYGELRLDLGRVASTMRNAYFLWRLGAGVEALGYDARARAFEDVSPLLVAEVGVGAQLTRAVGLEGVYRQQKNELPGGLLVGGGFDGFLGMLELDARIELAERWALVPGLRWGGGLMPWIALESQLY